VILAATGGFLSDQTAFWLGRVFGPWLMARSRRLAALQPGIRDGLERHTRWVGFSVRFAIGLRTAVPMAVGVSGVSPLRFAIPNAAGALTWAAVVGGAGYALGSVAAPWLRTATSFGPLGALALVLLVVIGIAARRFVRIRWMRPSSSKEGDA
jgi:membrane protein DedA with SNARE-associated domain